MSYPRFLQPLVVEDEVGPKLYYEALFEQLKKRFPVEPPLFAFCLEDALKMLASDRIFHLAVLDLRLPEHPNEPPPDDLNAGLAVLDRCEKREDYPIPGLLIISGHLGKAEQGILDARLRKGFAYGRVLAKGTLDADIEAAVEKVLCYCEVGIHMRDGGAKKFPTLAPREEDLLRRAVIDEGQCVGLDLGWWAAEYAPPTNDQDAYSGWTKTLQGKTLISKGRGSSRPRFYKFAPAAGAGTVGADARFLAAKLPHVKFIGEWVAGSRSLLVTEKVGESNAAPVALSEYLGGQPAQVVPHLSSVVANIAGQLGNLGDASPDQVLLKKLLWEEHDPMRLQAQWARWSKNTSSYGVSDPIMLYAELLASGQSVRIARQSALHGDLNVTNVALDLEPKVRGYIFDASGTAAGPNVRDLAALEVTALLHQPADESLVGACMAHYAISSVASPAMNAKMTNRAANTYALLGAIRDVEQVKSQPVVYALAVFDQALIQLGGLAFAVSRNKIYDPEEAARLAGIVACWVRHVVSANGCV